MEHLDFLLNQIFNFLFLDMREKYLLSEIKNIQIPIKLPCVIFLKGDLASGKTTLAKHILQDLLWVKEEVTSPTYKYYNKYLVESLEFWVVKKNEKLKTESWKLLTLHHFDLYRLSSYDEFFAIGWEEILDNNAWVILIEWPEIIEAYYRPDIEIILKKTEIEDERKIEIKGRGL